MVAEYGGFLEVMENVCADVRDLRNKNIFVPFFLCIFIYKIV